MKSKIQTSSKKVTANTQLRSLRDKRIDALAFESKIVECVPI